MFSIESNCIMQNIDGEKLWGIKHTWNFDKQNFDKLIIAFIGEALRKISQ